MNIEKLREEIAADEGEVHEIYLDHLGLAYFWHWSSWFAMTIRKADYPSVHPVDNDRVVEAFESDIETVLSDCNKLYPDFDDLPEEAQRVIANMMFNMGRPRLSKFKGMKSGVDARDWNRAADEMVDSRWYRQVTNRADRLVSGLEH